MLEDVFTYTKIFKPMDMRYQNELLVQCYIFEKPNREELLTEFEIRCIYLAQKIKERNLSQVIWKYYKEAVIYKLVP